MIQGPKKGGLAIMRVQKIMYFFIPILIVFECDIVLAEHFKDTPYFLEKEDRFILKIPSKKYWRYYLFGVYQKPYSFVSGERLYIFPNKTFLITKWCDICFEKVIDKGEWGVDGNKIVFNSRNSPGIKHLLVNDDGSYKKMNFLVIGIAQSVDSSS